MLTCSALALAVLCWPSRPASWRLRVLCGRSRSAAGALRRPGLRTLACAAAVACWLFSGPAAAFAALLLAWTIGRGRRANASLSGKLDANAAMTEALASLVAELRGGAHPGSAADRAARECRGVAATVLGVVANTVRLGGSVERALTGVANKVPYLAEPVARVGRAWELAERYGLPLAAILDSVRSDLENRTRFAGRVRARMAGPRASAFVLAALPVLGVLLGEAMGARPLAVLFGGGVGGALLLVGIALTAAGVVWTTRLTDRAVLP